MSELDNMIKPARAAIDQTNQKNLKAVPSGGTITYVYIRNLLFIGKHTDPAAVKILAYIEKNRPDLSKGKIEVKRELVRGKGVVKCTPPRSDRREFEDMIERISKKAVVYT